MKAKLTRPAWLRLPRLPGLTIGQVNLLAFALGVICVCAGASWIYPPAGLILLGLILMGAVAVGDKRP